MNSAKVYSERALTTVMDSVLAQFYGPLWEEYHIFGYYTGGDSETKAKDMLAKMITNDMSYTLDPYKDLDGLFKETGTDLLGITTKSVLAGNLTDLTEYDGELMVNEAIEYMKYREVGNGIEKLLDQMSLLETPGKVSYIMQEKQKAEEELVEVDREILNLMELYDGLLTTENGIVTGEDGKLKTTASFIKKICCSEITMDNVGINQEGIFQMQQGYYVNPSDYFSAIKVCFTQVKQILSQIDTYKVQISAAESRLSEKAAELYNLNVKKEKTNKDKELISMLKKDIKELKADIEENDKLLQKEQELLETQVSAIQATTGSIVSLLNEIKPLLDSAISSVNRLIDKMKAATPLIEQYEELLIGQKDNLSEDIYAGLTEELMELKKYTADDQSGYDFAGMKSILENNKSILSDVLSTVWRAEGELAGNNYSDAEISYDSAEVLLRGYQIHGLTLDYSTLVYDKTKSKASLDKISGLIQSGLSGLVIDPDGISDAKLPESNLLLPSETHALTADKTDFISVLTSFFKNTLIGKNSGMGELFKAFSDVASAQDAAIKGADALAELLLYQEYLKEHFSLYQPKAQIDTAQKPSVLCYELEYLLAGKASDAENLYSVISKLIFIRMIFDFISVISNAGIRSEAKLAAAALIGFTGLPVLVSITQLLILLIWSFAEALLDTCALMMGKEVPVIKKNILLTLPEIFLLNRAFLQNRASALTASKELSLSYRDYLGIFLLIKNKEDLAYRSMDLVQENIKIRYAVSNFKLKDCLYGFEASANFTVDSRFTGFSFLQKFLDSTQQGFQYTESAACSY